jgi:hypothetical protein
MTKSIPAETRSKLAKLIPRLASNHDGEVVSTRNAIARTLKAAGTDLHDLAQFVGRADVSPVVVVLSDNPRQSTTTASQDRRPDGPTRPTWAPRYAVQPMTVADSVGECEKYWPRLREVERDFVCGIKRRISRGLTVTHEDQVALDRISILASDRRRTYKMKKRKRMPAAALDEEWFRS